jgi:hypothetical protein
VLEILRCPPNPYAVRAIKFTKCDNLSVVNGAVTELTQSLSNFFIPVTNAFQATFVIPKRTGAYVPLENTLLSFGNIDTDNQVKYYNLFLSYPVGTTESLQYVEYTTVRSIEEGTLSFIDSVGPSSSAGISLDIDVINDIRNTNYALLGMSTDADTLVMSTSGGLMLWNGATMNLINHLKDSLPSDSVRCAVQDNEGYIWEGSDMGVCKVSPSGTILLTLDADGSELLSDDIRDLLFLTNDKLAIATSGGLSIYDKDELTWLNYTKFNTNELSSNDLRKMQVIDNVLYISSDQGIFRYDFDAISWSTKFSSSTAGWSIGSSSTSLAAYGSNLYVGASGGLVVVPTAGGTCTVITAGVTGPLSNSYNDLVVVTGLTAVVDRLVAAHPTGFSVYSLTGNSWSLTGASSSFSYFIDGCNTLTVKRRSDDRIYFGNNRGVGFYDFAGSTYGEIPGSTHNGTLLFYYPKDDQRLYSITQEFYFLFSKPIGLTSFQSNFSLIEGAGETGPTVDGTFTISNDGKVITFSPTALERASLYQAVLSEGFTSTDGTYFSGESYLSFYTEEFVPELGWNPIGKQLTHTGTVGKLLENVYLRNPHDFDVTVTLLVGN